MAAQVEESTGGKAKLMVTQRLPFPALGSVRGAYRMGLDLTVQGRTVPVFVDLVAVGTGRTEIALVVTAPGGAEAAVSGAEQRLARVLLARTRA